MHRFLDHPLPLAMAHRGGAHDGTENTLAAFDRAVSLGYRHIETDVHATVDGALVAFHDDRLDRTTDREGVIAHLSWHEVAQARVAGREPISRFHEVLEAFPQTCLNVDPKSDAAVDLLVRDIRRAGAEERICVGAFSTPRLIRVRRALPGVATSCGPNEVRALWLAARGLLPKALVPRFAEAVQVSEEYEGRTIVDGRFVRVAHDLGLQVHVWTVNDVEQMHRLLDLGVDGLISDTLTELRDVLSRRGQWHGGQ